jgi:hypothetical protein
MQILKRNDIDLQERRLIKNLYMDQSVEVRMDQRGKILKIGRGVGEGWCLSPILYK